MVWHRQRRDGQGRLRIIRIPRLLRDWLVRHVCVRSRSYLLSQWLALCPKRFRILGVGKWGIARRVGLSIAHSLFGPPRSSCCAPVLSRLLPTGKKGVLADRMRLPRQYEPISSSRCICRYLTRRGFARSSLFDLSVHAVRSPGPRSYAPLARRRALAAVIAK